jgi:sec-independent protein translocase protein TatA
VLILLIVVVLFGTKRLRNIGSDLGDAIKGFRKAVSDDKTNDADGEDKPASLEQGQASNTDSAATKTSAKSEQNSDSK